MTLDDFRQSLTAAKPPAELTLALAGLLCLKCRLAQEEPFFQEYASVVSDICWGSRASMQERRRVSAVRHRYQEVNLRQRGRFSGYSGSRLSFIAMMQPADLGYRHNSPHFRRLDRSWQG